MCTYAHGRSHCITSMLELQGVGVCRYIAERVSKFLPLVTPILQPLEPPHENFEVVALYDFPPKENVDLPLTKGQRVTIINSSRPHWWRARSEQGIEGYVPSNYVKKVGLETEE